MNAVIKPKERPMEYDLIIAGAGPAGMAAALHARQWGLRCLVLERRGREYHKPCGDGLTVWAIHALDRLGISLAALRSAGAQSITRSMHAYPAREDHLSFAEGDMLTLARPRLQVLLRERAEACGAAVRYGFQGEYRAEDGFVRAGDFTARGCVNATGARRFALAGGPPKPQPLGVSAYISARCENEDEHQNRFIHCLNDPNGYCWAFPLGGGVWNVGIWQTGDFERLKTHFEAFVRQELAARFPGFAWLSQPRGAFLGVHCGAAFQNVRFASCGDAAGACNILNGEGISSALDSGMLAVELLAARLGLCRQAAESDAALLQAQCPQIIEAIVPCYEAGPMGNRYLLRTAAGDLYARCREGGLRIEP